MPGTPRDELLLAVAKALVDHLRDGPNISLGGVLEKQDDRNADAIERAIKEVERIGWDTR